MQQAIGETVSAISDVAGRVEMVNETIGAIAAAVVEQDAVTRDIAQSVSQTADSVRLVHERIGSVATQAGVTTNVSTQLRHNTAELVGQVVNIEKRVIASLRNSRFAERRRAARVAVDLKAECVVGGVRRPAVIENISNGGAQIRLDGGIVPKETRLTLTLPEIGAIQAQVASAEGDVIHAHFLEMADDVRATLARALDRWHSGDDALISTVQAAARQISGLLDDTIDSGGISADAMFSTAYLPIEGADPQQYMMAYTELFDQLLPPIQEAVLQKEARIDFCATVDRNGYLPTHNLKYSQPQRPGDGSEPFE
jgi:aerotaxis receptor